MHDPIPTDVQPHSLVLMQTDQWLVGVPLNMHAMSWWGGFTDWCVGHDAGWFTSYNSRGTLIIFRARQREKRWALHATTGEFRDQNNRKAGWRGFLMRNPEVSAALMHRLTEIRRPDPELLAPLLNGMIAMSDLARFAAYDYKHTRMKLDQARGAAEEALSWLNGEALNASRPDGIADQT